MLRTIALFLLVLGIISAGCSSPAHSQTESTPRPTQSSFYQYGNGTFNVNGTLQQVNGTLHIASIPSGADVYIDNEYWCPTNCALPYVIPPGHHTVEIRKNGYESKTYPVTVVKGGMDGITAELVSTQGNLTVTSARATTPP
ncbi:PEGA domain-containing protein [uncultured Methanoregula sp.]|uniref:PEGA domain-containing protein n=1 Tax=uncultured Methanoregula sp. TaxID=1005933 RepID=UPI002AAB69D3|nr:PEGA domain-containing protein [uncultured Methanoregula sp.]